MRSFLGIGREIWPKARFRLIQIVVATLIPIYRALPPRLVFAGLVVCQRAKMPALAALKRAFVPVAASQERNRPGRPLTSWVSDRFPNSTSVVLFGVEAYRQCSDFTARRSAFRLPHPVYEVWSRSLFELGRFKEARDVLALRPELRRDFSFAQLIGHLDLLQGETDDAIPSLERAVLVTTSLFCPHQNLAARYPHNYVPTRLDAFSGPDGLLFDAYNYIGQRVTHVGEGQLSPFFYGEALAAQRRLRISNPPQLSPDLQQLLSRLNIRYDELRVLPTEWYTQVGHQGMLDMLFRMRDVGWWTGKAIFLVPPESVANRAFQTLFESYGPTVLTDADPLIARELFSLQRWCGMNFNAFELPSGEVVPWQEAGAKVMLEWDGAGRGSPIREAFDRSYGDNPTLQTAVANWRDTWGMSSDDWYVCLHMRDASHYGEVAGTGQTHRNTGVSQYQRTIEYITSRGGWVVKLGGPNSPKLPQLPHVIDYARSEHKSEIMDLHLIRHARLFIGTTSGLTNVAVSFGVPCALVNCITTDAQLWGDRVRFALKRIRLRDGTDIDQQQLTSTPWRWRVFGADVLARHGATLIENSADEILEIVKEVEALAQGESRRYTRSVPDADALLSRWRDCLAMPHFYGAGQPSLYFLAKHEARLLPRAVANMIPVARAAVPQPS